MDSQDPWDQVAAGDRCRWPSREMKRNRILLALFVVAIAAASILVGHEVCRGPRSLFAGFDRGMQTKYENIRKGSPKTDVLAALGHPRRIETRFCLPQQQGFENLFEEADRSESIEYYLWMNGMNWYYRIGFDRKGIVSMKGEGNS